MFLKLLKYFHKNPFLINGISPYDIGKILKTGFNKKENLSFEERKQVCLLVDLLRFLVLDSKIKIKQQNIVFFGSTFSSSDEDAFFQTIYRYAGESKGFLAFIYKKLKNKERSLQILNQFDEKIILEYLKKY